jgi:hypothetical protein
MVNAAVAVARRESLADPQENFVRVCRLPANAFFRSPGGVSRRAAPPGQPGWLTEGFDTRDLKEAKALLAELA